MGISLADRRLIDSYRFLPHVGYVTIVMVSLPYFRGVEIHHI